jgi:hypothetical protein
MYFLYSNTLQEVTITLKSSVSEMPFNYIIGDMGGKSVAIKMLPSEKLRAIIILTKLADCHM